MKNLCSLRRRVTEDEGQRQRVTGKANSLSKGAGAGAGAGTGAEPQHLKSHGANSGESPAGRATRLRVASRQEKGRAQTQGVCGD